MGGRFMGLFRCQLAQVGIQRNISTAATPGEFFSDTEAGKYAAEMLPYGGLPAATLYQTFLTADTFDNPFGVPTPTALTMLNHKLINARGTSAIRIARQIGTCVTQQALMAPIVAVPITVFYRPSVTGINQSNQRKLWYVPEIQPAK
jgi:hypothetical protein